MFFIPQKYVLIVAAIAAFVYFIHLAARFAGFNNTGHEP